MKKLIVLLITLIIISTITLTATASNSIYLELIESDTSYKSFGGEVGILEDFSLTGAFNFSRIDQYSIELNINQLNLGFLYNLINTQKLNSQLGIGYNYKEANLASTYFPNMNLNSNEQALMIIGEADVKLDDSLSAFGQINYAPWTRLKTKIISTENNEEVSDKLRKYTAKVGIKFKVAENLKLKLGYNYNHYFNSQVISEDIKDESLKKSFNNNQSGIFFGLESNF